MDYPNQVATESVDSFILESVLIQSDRLSVSVGVENVTTDLDIYEHLDKPYLTGSLIFVDSQGIFTGIDFIGGERVTITIRSTRKNSKAIVKTFYVTSVMNAQKVNDHNEVIGLYIIEDIGYFSNLINVNKSYKGSCYKIIRKIANDYFNKSVTQLGIDKQSDFTAVVPNLNPIETLSWIKNKATDTNGFPFFLYSTLVENSIKFSSLTSLIDQDTMNPFIPFTFWQNSSTADNRTVQRRTINSYTYADTENLFELIRDGVVGSSYTYLDTFSGTHTEFQFDVMKDALNPYKNKKIDRGITQTLPMDENLLTFSGISINKVPSRNISQIAGNGAYRSESSKSLSYNEETEENGYKKKVISRAMLKFLTKAPISIIVNGQDFLDGDYSTTIGSKLRVEFVNSTIDTENQSRIDPKRSGDFLIYAARHMFKKERYDLTLSCVKIGNTK